MNLLDFAWGYGSFFVDASWLMLGVMIVAAIAFSYRTLNSLWWAWDDGNNLYPAFALLRGKKPNVDFRSGYLGMQAALFAFLLRRFGMGLYPVKIAVFVSSLITSMCVYYLVREFFPYGAVLGLIAAALTFMSSYLVFPAPNAGFIMEALASVATVILYTTITYMLITGDVDGWSVILAFHAVAILIGLSITFKQSGLFHMLGFVAVLTLLCQHDTLISAIARLMVFALGCVLPCVIFLWVRLKHIPDDVMPRAWVLMTWIAALALLGRYVVMGQPDVHDFTGVPLWLCISSGLTMIAAAFSWVFIYGFDPAAWKKVFRECFVIVPPLIDRDMPKVSMPEETRKILVWAFGLMATSGLAAYLAPMIPTPDMPYIDHVWWAGGWLVVLSLGALWVSFRPVVRKGLQGNYWAPSLLGAVAALVVCFAMPVKISLAAVVVILIGLYATLSIFPYHMNPMFAVLGVVTCLMLYVFVVGAFTVDLPTPLAAVFQGGALSVLLGATVANTHYVQEVWNTIKQVTKQGNIVAPGREVPFLWAAEWLKKNTPPNATFMSYPNLAICLTLAERMSEGFFPNFLGLQEDFDAIIKSIDNGTGPDYMLVSPAMYPYMKATAYCYASTPIVDALKRTYDLVGQCNAQNGECLIAIYRKKPQTYTSLTLS